MSPIFFSGEQGQGLWQGWMWTPRLRYLTCQSQAHLSGQNQRGRSFCTAGCGTGTSGLADPCTRISTCFFIWRLRLQLRGFRLEPKLSGVGSLWALSTSQGWRELLPRLQVGNVNKARLWERCLLGALCIVLQTNQKSNGLQTLSTRLPPYLYPGGNTSGTGLLSSYPLLSQLGSDTSALENPHS